MEPRIQQSLKERTGKGRLLILLLLLLVPVLMLRTAGRAVANSGDLATADGRSVSAEEAANLEVTEIPTPLTVDSYDVLEEPAEVIEHHTPPGNFKRTLWGYEAAASGALIRTYDIGPTGTGPVAPGPTCAPPFTENGRGIAFDPLDGNVWYTRVNFVTLPAFGGDGLIHKTNPPNTTAPCTLVASIPFGDGPGGTIQDDVGALDLDQGSKHIWAAGYAPVIVAGVPRSFLYLVNRNNGKIIHSCSVPFGGGGVGNDTLAYARLSGLPGSGQYLLTDAGEPITPFNGNMLLVIDTAQCKGGAAVAPVATFVKSPVGMTGVDFEWPGLLATDGFVFYNSGGSPPFAPATPIGATGTANELEDISACGFRALFGGGGNDGCPYP